MTRPLYEYRPEAQMIAGIKRQLAGTNGDPDAIPVEWIEVISAATFKWIAETPEGKSRTFDLLSLEETKGRPDRVYEARNQQGQVVETVPYEDITFAGGCFIRGIPFPTRLVSIKESPKHHCDDCGARVHCVKEIANHRNDRLESYCNGCLVQSEDLKNRDAGDGGMCVNCSDTTCTHNHIHLRRLNGDTHSHQW